MLHGHQIDHVPVHQDPSHLRLIVQLARLRELQGRAVQLFLRAELKLQPGWPQRRRVICAHRERLTLYVFAQVSYRDALSSSEDESMDKNKYATSIAVVPLGVTRPPGA